MIRRVHLCVAVLLLALVATSCGDDDALPVFTTTSTAGTTVATTTSAPASTTSAAPSTTVATTTTSTSTTTSSTTTTTAPPPPPLLFEVDGLGIAHFGDDPDVVTGLVTAILGAPSFDSGWIPGGFGDYGVCPGTEYRRVEFDGGDLVLQFSDADYFGPAGVRQFFAYNWFGGVPGPTLGPPTSIDAGTTVAQLIAMYPAVELYDDDPFFGYTFRVAGAGWNQLWGTLTGTTPADTILSVTGGVGCGE